MRNYFVILFAFFVTINAYSQSKTYKIGYLLEKSSVEIEALLDDLSSEISAVVGEDAIMEFPTEYRLVNNFSTDQAIINYNQLINNDADIIVAFGKINNLIITRNSSFPKPTIVFGTLSEELIANEETLNEIPNFTSITTTHSFKKDLSVFKELAKPEKIGIAVEQPFVDDLRIEDTFIKIGEELGIEIKLLPFTSLNDIILQLDGLGGLYLAGGFYLSDEEIANLAKELIERKIPSFSANPEKDVKNGILASNYDQSGLNQFFRKIALTIESIVTGDELSGVGTKIDSKLSLTINYNTAQKIDLPIKYSLIATTTFIGDPKLKVAEKNYNLVGVLQEAIAKNLDLQTLSRDITLTEKDVQIAKSDYLPNVSAGATGSYVDPELATVSNGQNPEITTSSNVTLQQTVFSESANANISIQKSLREAQKENYNSEALNVILNVATAYFTTLILKSNLAIQSKNLELTKYNLRIATENYEAGQSGKSDVLRFRSEMAQNTQQLIEAINQLEQGYYTLNQLLNNPIDTDIDVDEAELKKGIFSNYNYEQLGQFLDDPTLRKPFLDFLVQEAIYNAPELKALQYNIEATERSERLYGAGRFLPTVALQGQYYYEFSRSGAGVDFPTGFPSIPEGYYNLGLNVSIPIFNQNKQNLNQQIASIQKEQLEISKENIELNIEKNINDSVIELVNQISNIELSKLFEDTAKEALDLTQTSYANGAVNIVQLLDAQNNYLQAQLASANATYNYLQSAMQLERSLGLFFLLQDQSEREAFAQRFLEFLNNNED